MTPGAEEEAGRLLDVIARVPRAAGGPGEAVAREFCADYLRAAGFTVREEPFSYSSFAGRLAAPLAGVLLVSLFAVTSLAALRGDIAAAAIVMGAHLLLLAGVAGLSSGNSIARLPFMSRNAVNLTATAGSGEPRVWLMAHLDSKSQPISILARGVAVSFIIVLGFAALVLLTVHFVVGGIWPVVWYGVGLLGVLSAIPLVLSGVGDDSHGALDNASGVATTLMASASLVRSGTSGFGVLLTSAEELGLAGAHVWSDGRAPALAINCDSVDDVGTFLCLVGRSRAGAARGAVRAAAAESETTLVERRMLSGILVDSMALEARGWDAVTVCKGTLRSLNRIHTHRDVRTAITGAGVADAADLIGRACRKLLDRG